MFVLFHGFSEPGGNNYHNKKAHEWKATEVILYCVVNFFFITNETYGN